MADKKEAPKDYTNIKLGWYKNYDIKWLKSVRDEHPDGYLVDEFEKANGEIK